jgi:hypothetical protein
LADAEELISGETDNKGCSKVTDTSLLTPAIRNGKTLLFVIGSRLTFVDIELSNQTLTTQPQISNYDFEIDIQPLNK